MMNMKQKMSKASSRTLKGFSLGEVILSVVVLTVGLLPILGSMNGAFSTSRDSQNTVIAAGLAQEGVELVVNVKDNGVLTSNDAFIGFSGGNHTCRIDYDDAVLSAPATIDIECGNALSHDLTLNGSDFYVHAGVAGKFKRKIFINHTGNKDNGTASVVSAVYWGTHVPNDKSTCTTANSCVYSEATLRPWK